ncbi:MAG: acyl CoA--acetate/3-ketoacid CoA transferase subunit alpha [Nocardiopsaceae bacterium]|nr:acyl CoA--acetate/3-ketoacid CoA transferase subunit alpha [Nocardiopsaceae bacterium]
MTTSARTAAVNGKIRTEDEVVAQLSDGMTLGIGGWGSRAKPMSLVRAILRSDLRDLTVVSFGGPDVGMLCAAKKVKRVVFPFVSLDSIALEPHFRKARESGEVAATEMDEGMLLLGLQAAAWRVPFLPTRVGLGSDLPQVWPELRTVRSPYPGPSGDEGEELIAVPAIHLDAAIVHVNRCDADGNGQILRADPYFDDLFLEAAKNRFVSCEQVVPTSELTNGHPVQSLRIHRLMVDGVVEAPGGAHPTSCEPDYPRDEEFQRRYAAAAREEDGWPRIRQEWLRDCADHDNRTTDNANTQERKVLS